MGRLGFDIEYSSWREAVAMRQGAAFLLALFALGGAFLRIVPPRRRSPEMAR